MANKYKETLGYFEVPSIKFYQQGRQCTYSIKKKGVILL